MTEANAPVIAVDGPSGSGKGTVSRALAGELGWHFLDSGALYRVLAVACRRAGLSAESTAQLEALARDLKVTFSESEGRERILLEGRDVTTEARTEACGAEASRLAVIPEARAGLLSLQRRFRRLPGLVADGRDMGTVVFPDAICKIFLTATPAERAKRRHKQLKEKGLSASLDALSRDIARRDRRDASRAVSPLKPAVDATVIDSTGLSVEEVLGQIRGLVRDKLGSGRFSH